MEHHFRAGTVNSMVLIKTSQWQSGCGEITWEYREWNRVGTDLDLLLQSAVMRANLGFPKSGVHPAEGNTLSDYYLVLGPVS